MHRIVKFVEKLSWVSEKLQRNLHLCFGPYPFSGRNSVFWPVKLECSRYCWYLNRYEMRTFLYRFRHQYEKYRPYRPVQYETDYTAANRQMQSIIEVRKRKREGGQNLLNNIFLEKYQQNSMRMKQFSKLNYFWNSSYLKSSFTNSISSWVVV